MAGRHHAASPFAVLGVIRKLNGVQRPDVRAQAAHRKLCRTVTRMTINNVRLDSENIFHHVPCIKTRGSDFSLPLSKIGRASCRERGSIGVGAGCVSPTRNEQWEYAIWYQ